MLRKGVHELTARKEMIQKTERYFRLKKPRYINFCIDPVRPLQRGDKRVGYSHVIQPRFKITASSHRPW